MASAEIDRFVQTVVNDHGFATGIKSLGSHYALVRFASERGFQFSCSEWGRYWAMDCLQAPDDVLDRNLMDCCLLLRVLRSVPLLTFRPQLTPLQQCLLRSQTLTVIQLCSRLLPWFVNVQI